MEGTADSPGGGDRSPGTVECFQNFTAPEVFVQGLAGMVNQGDAETIIRSQKYMLQRFEKTNEMLYNCNAVSAARYQNAARDFKKHTALLQEMRKDVDNIFRRIRSIKAKISQQYPQAYAVAATAERREKSQQDDEDEDEDEEEEETERPAIAAKSPSVSSMPTSSSTAAGIESFRIPVDKSASIDIPRMGDGSDRM